MWRDILFHKHLHLAFLLTCFHQKGNYSSYLVYTTYSSVLRASPTRTVKPPAPVRTARSKHVLPSNTLLYRFAQRSGCTFPVNWERGRGLRESGPPPPRGTSNTLGRLKSSLPVPFSSTPPCFASTPSSSDVAIVPIWLPPRHCRTSSTPANVPTCLVQRCRPLRIHLQPCTICPHVDTVHGGHHARQVFGQMSLSSF